MPSATVSTSSANFALIISALDAKHEREDGETDAQLWRRDLKAYYTELVFAHQRGKASAGVAADPNITEVT